MNELNIIWYAIAVLSILGAVFGLILAFASKVFAVKTDERQEAILEILPGANCGGCGYAGCSAYASAVVNANAPVNSCSPGGSETANKIAKIMGVEDAGDTERYVAFVHCAGGDKALKKYQYTGLDDCSAAVNTSGGGPLKCQHGCLGLGNCVKACPFGAISILRGTAHVDKERCTGCMKCQAACPKNVIAKVQYNEEIHIPCRNTDKGSVVRKLCEVGCMGCKLCEKNCPKGAVKVVNNVALRDHATCMQCGTCILKCPRHLIESDHPEHLSNTEVS